MLEICWDGEWRMFANVRFLNVQAFYICRTLTLITPLIPAAKKSDFLKPFSRTIIPGLLLLCSIVLTIIAWYISRNNLTERTKERFEYTVTNIQSAIQVRMSAYEQVLRNAVGFFNAADTVTRSEWTNYVQTLKLQQNYPGILGLGFSIRLSPQALAPFVNRVRAEGFPRFSVWPEGLRDEYHAIVYLEPFRDRNLRAFGFDMYTEQNRREAMQRARETGQPALSHFVTLVQETTKDIQRGVLLYLPVYSRNVSLSSAGERNEALRGFVYSPFRIKDLMTGILGLEPPEVEFEMYDGNKVDTANLLYTSHGYNNKKTEADFSLPKVINVAGRDWTLVFTSRPNFVSAYEVNQPNVIAIAGIVVNIVLLFALVKLNSLGYSNKVLAERYKEEKDRYEIISLSTNDIIWEWDLASQTVGFNKNFELVLGYNLPKASLSFDGWINYIHPDDRNRVAARLNAVTTTEKKFWKEEYRLLKAGGSSIFILDRGRLIFDADGTPLRLVGSMINITERKNAEEAQRRFNEELETTVQARTLELQRSNEDLERFAHVASHDLKEPVRKVLTSIDMIRTRYQHILGDGIVLLDRVTKSALRLNQMIDSILAYSTVKYEPQKAEMVDLNAIMQNVKEDLELIISEKSAELVVAPLPSVEGSPVLLHQLFYNLVNNSLKFSSAGVKPLIRVDAQNSPEASNDVVIRVSDNGIGFTEDDGSKIFQSFVRLHPKDRYEGTGLGLALCQRIVDRHNGHIEAVGAPGKGATFIVHLPGKQKGGVI